MKKNILMVLITVSLLTGCAGFTEFMKSDELKQGVKYAVNTATVAQALLSLDEEIIKARAVIANNKAKFTDDEWQKLVDAGTKIDEIRLKIGNMIHANVDITEILVNLVEIDDTVTDITKIYNTVNDITQAHFDEFTAEQKNKIMEARMSLIKLHTTYQQLKAANTPSGDEKDATNIVQNIVSIGAILVQIIKVITPLLAAA